MEPEDTRDVRDEAGDVLVLDPETDVDRPLVPDPVRDEAEPDLLLEELGVRDPDGGGGTTRDSDPPLDDEVDDPDELEDPDDPEEPDEVGRGIACAASAAGAARAIATATTISERGYLSMSMHSLNPQTDRVALDR